MCFRIDIALQFEKIFHKVIEQRMKKLGKKPLLSQGEPIRLQSWAKRVDEKMVENFIVSACSNRQFLTYDSTKTHNAE